MAMIRSQDCINSIYAFAQVLVWAVFTHSREPYSSEELLRTCVNRLVSSAPHSALCMLAFSPPAEDYNVVDIETCDTVWMAQHSRRVLNLRCLQSQTRDCESSRGYREHCRNQPRLPGPTMHVFMQLSHRRSNLRSCVNAGCALLPSVAAHTYRIVTNAPSQYRSRIFHLLFFCSIYLDYSVSQI